MGVGDKSGEGCNWKAMSPIKKGLGEFNLLKELETPFANNHVHTLRHLLEV